MKMPREFALLKRSPINVGDKVIVTPARDGRHYKGALYCARDTTPSKAYTITNKHRGLLFGGGYMFTDDVGDEVGLQSEHLTRVVA